MSSQNRRRRPVLAGLASLALAVGASVLATPPRAHASSQVEVVADTDGYNVVDRPATTATADSLPTAQIDRGVVWKQLIAGNTVFVGGEFSNARPAGAAPGTSLVPRGNLMSYDVTTGVMTAWNPQVNGKVTALALSPDGRRLYVGGSFTQVGGQPRANVAAFDVATGALLPGFAPAVNSGVGSITVTDQAVYLGGHFTAINGNTRLRLAALTPTGQLTGWAPTADNYVGAMVVVNGAMVVGGQFAYVNGQVAQGSARLDLTSGASLPWAGNTVITNHGNSSGIHSLSVDGTDVLATGWKFNTSDEGNFEGVVRLDGTTGKVVWMADCHGDSYDATAANGLVYSVSHHHNCQNMGTFGDQGVFERAQAFVDQASTTTRPNQTWNYTDFGGQPAPATAAWTPALEAGNFTSTGQAAWTATSDSRYVLLGGEFPTVNGQVQQGIARFATPAAGAPRKSGPVLFATGTTPWTARATVVGNDVRIGIPINHDRDGLTLTYEVHRTDQAAALHTFRADSTWWTSKGLSFTDTTVEPGRRYDYYVTAIDADGNTQRSNTAGVTTPVATVDDAYQQMVLADGAVHYWRQGDPSGTGTSVDLAGGNDLVDVGGVTKGAAGMVKADGAATFDGSTGLQHTTHAEVGPTSYTAELWFRTTSTRGGRLVGFGNSATDASGSHDRKVWLDDAGHVNFGNYDGNVHAVSSPASYNDGKWHHVAATTSDAIGTTLFVDGVQVAATEGRASDAYRGYWRIGQDTQAGWPNTPTSEFLEGTVDEVAIYGAPLDASTIRDHFTTGAGVAAPAVYDPYGKAVVAARPRLYWRLDETTGTLAADASGLGDEGTVTGAATWGAASTVAPGTALRLDGGQVTSQRATLAPAAFSTEAWFNTTNTTGGRLVGLGDARTGTSHDTDRMLWIDGDGAVHFGINPGWQVQIASAAGLNDGRWHQVVGSLDPFAGMRLYVDGVEVASNATTSAQSYTGYWRAGADLTWGGAGQSLGGLLDEVAVYDRAVTAGEVAQRYALKGAELAPNQAPTAQMTATTDGLAVSVDGSGSTDPDGTVTAWSWDFGDGTPAVTGAKVNHVYAAAGTYTVTLTATDDRGGRGTTTQQVTVAPPVVAADALVQDDFSAIGQGWGSADAGGAWTVSRAAAFTRDGATGNIAVGRGTENKATLASATAQDVDVAVDQSIDRLPLGGGGLYSRLHVRDQGSTSYATMLRWQADGRLHVGIVRFVNGAQSGELGWYDVPGGYTPGQVFRVRLQATGSGTTTLKATVWAKGTTEPAPQVTVTDSTAALQVPGAVAVSSYLSGSSTVTPVVLRVDDLRGTGSVPAAEAPSTPGTSPTTPPVTDEPATPSPTPTPTAPAVVETTVASDAFEGTRTRWGTADLGGAYAYGTSSAFSTAGGQGVVTVPPGATARATLPVTMANGRVSAEVSFGSLPSAGALYTRVEARAQASDKVWAHLRLTNSGALYLTVTQVVGGVQTDLSTVPVPGTYAPGSVLRLELTVDSANGTTTLGGKVYPAGKATALAGTTATTTAQSVQNGGPVGISGYLSTSATSPVAIRVDNLLAASH